MKSGFVPALGTPLDENGSLVAESYRKEIEDQIKAGAVGLLSMGSMGIQAFIRNSVCRDVAKTAVEAAAGRVPVFVGAMDCSIAKARDRMQTMEDLDLAAFVLTTPYYEKMPRQEIINFFLGVCASTKHKIMLYDLPVVTQSKITYDMVLELLRSTDQIAGIKSADLEMFRHLKLNPEVPDDFIMVYSGLDTFDIAYKWGIDKCLDGMLSCTPVNTKKLFDSMNSGDYVHAAEYLDRIIALRDCFAKHKIWPSYTAAMNMLGYAGSFVPDYADTLRPEQIAEIKEKMKEIGEL